MKNQTDSKYMQKIEDLIALIDEPNRSVCMRLYKENELIFNKASAAVHNHQAWDGGYLDHV